jgi:hypothetical protein
MKLDKSVKNTWDTCNKMSAENSREGGILPGYYNSGVRFHEAIMKLFSRQDKPEQL